MDPAHPRHSLRRQLLVPLAMIGMIVAAAVLLAVRREMRAQLETQLLAQARLVADAARRIAQTGGTREELPRFVPMLGSGQGVRSLFIIGALAVTESSPEKSVTPPPAHVSEEFARVGAALADAFREVRALNSDLEARVAARTAELVSSLERERETARLKTNDSPDRRR